MHHMIYVINTGVIDIKITICYNEVMDISSKPTGNSQKTITALDKFELFYETVPVKSAPGRTKRSGSNDSK